MNDEERCCQQCDAPLGEDRLSPNDPRLDEQMCGDCEAEYTGRRHVRVKRR